MLDGSGAVPDFRLPCAQTWRWDAVSPALAMPKTVLSLRPGAEVIFKAYSCLQAGPEGVKEIEQVQAWLAKGDAETLWGRSRLLH